VNHARDLLLPLPRRDLLRPLLWRHLRPSNRRLLPPRPVDRRAKRQRTLEADCRKYPAEHSRSAGRAGLLEIDCLLNDPAPVFYKLAPSGSEYHCVSSNGTKEMSHREMPLLQLQPWIFPNQIS
jgi:hypothetical protein